MSRIDKKLKTTAKGREDMIKKQANDLNGHFSKEDTQVPKRYILKCLIILTIREMQVKTRMRYHLTPVSVAIAKIHMLMRIWT